MAITGEQVRQAMIAANITVVDHHECGACGCMVHFYRDGNQLFFDPDCGCLSRYGPELRDWKDAADWINMQTDEKWRAEIMRRFGLAPGPSPQMS